MPTSNLKDSTLAFVGAGRMATALARGLVSSGTVGAGGLIASDASPAAVEAFARAVPGARAADSNRAATEEADVVVLAVKPQYLPAVLEEISEAVDEQTLVISIAAGIPLSRLSKPLLGGARVVRAMPNTPCLVGSGASAFCLGEHATPEDGRIAAELLGAVGAAHELTEPMIDAVTGLSGSGPAFVYTVIEAMSDAGVRAGLPRSIAADLAARTVAGAAQMVIETGEHPAPLRDAVTSPGGTTAAGLAALERHGLRHAIGAAVDAATARSKELGAD